MTPSNIVLSRLALWTGRRQITTTATTSSRTSSNGPRKMTAAATTSSAAAAAAAAAAATTTKTTGRTSTAINSSSIPVPAAPPSCTAVRTVTTTSTSSTSVTIATTATSPPPVSSSIPSSSAAGHNGPKVLGSSLGSDVEMIAANHRKNSCGSDSSSISTTSNASSSTTTASSSSSSSTTTTTTTSSNRSYATEASSPATMKDEYGEMDDSGEAFIVDNYELESGQVLPQAELRYQTYGELNEARDNCIVVCHALTGNASLHGWWGDLLGPQRVFDTSKYFVVCCNILGSCYGSTSPTSINPETNEVYGVDFPDVSVKDTVNLQLRLLQDQLNISSIKSVIGGSFGGMQAVEFSIQAGSRNANFTDDDGRPFVRSIVPIACGAQHTAWQIAVSEVQRQAIYKDPMWEVNPFEATDGLEVARQIGMVSYRTPVGYSGKFGRHLQNNKSEASARHPYGSKAPWRVKSYLEYQGVKFLSRFDPVTYVKLTEQMDSHDVSRGRGNLADVLGGVEIPALVLGIDSDVLYPLHEQQELAHYIPNTTLKVIHSDDGHDGFLLEQEQVGNHITEFLALHD